MLATFSYLVSLFSLCTYIEMAAQIQGCITVTCTANRLNQDRATCLLLFAQFLHCDSHRSTKGFAHEPTTIKPLDVQVRCEDLIIRQQ